MSQVIKTAASCVGSSLNEPRSDSVISNMEMFERTEAVVRGLDLLLEHHGASNLIRDDMRKQVHLSLDNAQDELVWLKRIKFLTAYPLSSYLKNELPPLPDQAFKPSGALRAWMRQRIVSRGNRKNTHLWYSWLQTKRSALCLSDDFIEQTYATHLATLTKKDPGVKETIQMILEEPTFERLLETTAIRVFENYYNTKNEVWQPSDFTEGTPSGSACFENSRRKLGQYGRLQKLTRIPDFCPYTDLVRMTLVPSLSLRNSKLSTTVIEVRQPCGVDDWKSLKISALEMTIEMLKCGSKPNATIQGLLEPLKVRVISKGEALPYYYCKPLQKAFLNAIQDSPSFRPTGRPISPTDLIDLAQKAQPNWNWFSVDYSAATDGLSWKYSQAILKSIMRFLPRHVRFMAEKVLGPHELYYPMGHGMKEWRGTQTNGQLMGSILSFPILCLANMGVYLLTTQNEHKGWSDLERLNHVLVNGDDMLYASHPDNWGDHVKIARDVGLEMSVGKAYSSSYYANINSTSYHYDLSLKEKSPKHFSPWQIDYLNTGLFFGQNKVLGTCDDDEDLVGDNGEVKALSVLDCAAIPSKVIIRELTRSCVEPDDMVHNLLSPLNRVLQGALPGKSKSILMKFLSLHASRIRAEQMCLLKINGTTRFFSRNLFLPISLGGMGIEKPLGFGNKVKPIQKKVAKAILLNHPDMIHNSQRPVYLYEPTKIETDLSVPWRRSLRPAELPQRVISDLTYKTNSKILGAFQNLLTGYNSSCYIL